MRTEIRTENLILRKYKVDFIPLLFEAASESKGGDFSRWLPWSHENYSIADSESFVKKTIENWKDSTQFGYAIFNAQTNKFLGGTGLNQPSAKHNFLNLGYWVRMSRQNRGIASEATRALAKAAFEDLPELNRIEILAATGNIPSRKAAEKSGAISEGILRKRLIVGERVHDAAIFSFVRDDFE